jgi:hypothetical protein
MQYLKKVKEMKKDYTVTAICYSDENFSDAQKLNIWAAKHIGKADKTIAFGPDDIDDVFREEHSDILKFRRGGGYWIWKPYVIYNALIKAEEGEYIFYFDSGCVLLKPLHIFIDFMKSKSIDLLCFYTPFPEIDWDKKILYDKYASTFNLKENIFQIEGAYICVQKNNRTLKIIKEWLDSCSIAENLLDHDLKPMENHRHDQSNFSLVCKKNGVTAYRNPSNRYLYELFDETLNRYYRSESDMKKYKEMYFSLEEVPGTEFSIFSHSRKNSAFYLLRVFKTMLLFQKRFRLAKSKNFYDKKRIGGKN